MQERLLCTALVVVFVTLACLVAESHEQGVKVIKVQPQDSLQVQANCTHTSATLTTLRKDSRAVSLNFSAYPAYDVLSVTSLTCKAYLTTQPRYVISAVLLEHSPCGGGVHVVLRDDAHRRRWDVCSTWHAPGPDFMASSNVAEVTVILSDVTDPCDFTIHVSAMKKPKRGDLEVRYLSVTEGKTWWFNSQAVFYPYVVPYSQLSFLIIALRLLA